MKYRKTDRGRLRDVEQRIRRTVGGTSTVINNGVLTPLSDDSPNAVGTTSAGISTSASRSDHVHTDSSAIQFIFDGGTIALTATLTCDIYCPFAFTILSATVLADQSGSAAFDVRKDTYANYPPTGADSIVASAPPTISTAIKSKDTTLTGWTTSVAAGTTLQAYLTSTATVIRLTLTLEIRKTT